MGVDQAKVFKIERYDPKAIFPSPAEADLTWRDAFEAPCRLSGFRWFAQDRVYRRLPLKPAAPLPPDVNGLANCTAGGQVAFRTDSPCLAIRVKLASPPDAWNISPVGQCGFDAYLGEPGTQKYIQSAKVVVGHNRYEAWLYEFLPQATRTVTLNFPLYKGVERVELGVAHGSKVDAPPPFAKPGPVIVYGTSITQGASASRPGMLYTNILSRRLNLEFVNLGFSGSALCEPEVAHAITAMPLAHEPAGLVLDCDSNIRDTNLLRERHPAFLKLLRARWPRVPCFVLSKPPFMTETAHPEVAAYRLDRRDFLKQYVAGWQAAGDTQIFFVDGGELYGDDWHECTIDQRHTTDLGFYRMAGALEPLMRRAFLNI